MDANERRIIKTRQISAVLAIGLVSVVLGISVLAFLRYPGPAGVVSAFLLAGVAFPILRSAWRLGAFALLWPPPPGPPQIPSAYRQCPVCGSLLRRQLLADGWHAVCPACTFQLLIER